MTAEHRLKRLRLRSWRRGTREMDLLLGPFADTHLAAMTADDLDLYEALLGESDPELYAWTSGRDAPPERYRPMVERIAAHASDKVRAT